GVLLSGCYSDTVVELPDNKPLVVINSDNFQPDSTWSVELTKSVSFYYSSGNLYINNANVKIVDEQGTITQLSPIILQDRTVYKSDQRPLKNKLYTIKVEAPGFPITSATSKIPEPVQITKIEIDSTFFIEQKQAVAQNPDYNVDASKPMQCKIFFNDPAHEANYYAVRLYVEGEIQYTNDAGETVTKTKFFEYPLVEPETYNPASLLTDDTKFNGLQYALQFNIPFHLFFNPVGNLQIVLTSLSSDRYNYMQSVKLQNTNKHDPFAQPVIIHNNIQNGLGLFGGFSKSVWILQKPSEETASVN
ncbi:MAG: DUF4249 domain-containing protein, partial [Cyclobacteriaceae bacterium]|nr:DUF4249 domain-containing protein [Cyclobacteriaceae bacterium]